MAQNNFFNRLFNRNKIKKEKVDVEKISTEIEMDDSSDNLTPVDTTPVYAESTSTALISTEKTATEKRQEQLVSFLTGYFNDKFGYILNNHIMGDGTSNAEVVSAFAVAIEEYKEQFINLFKLDQDAFRKMLTDRIFFIGTTFYDACKNTPVTESDKRQQIFVDAKEVGTMFSDFIKDFTKDIFSQESLSTRHRISALQNKEFDNSRDINLILHDIQFNIFTVDFVHEYLTLCKKYAENGVSIFLDLQNSFVHEYMSFILKFRKEFENQELISSVIKLYDSDKERFFEDVYMVLSDMQGFDKDKEDASHKKAEKDYIYHSEKYDSTFEKARPNVEFTTSNIEKLLNTICKNKNLDFEISDFNTFIVALNNYHFRGDFSSDLIDKCLNSLEEDEFAFKYNFLKLWHEYLKASSEYLQTELRREVAGQILTLADKRIKLHELFKEFETAENARLRKSMFMPE